MIPCKLQSLQIPASVELSALSEVVACLDGSMILGANTNKDCWNGFSYWLVNPQERFEFRSDENTPFEKLENVFSRYSIETDCADLGPGMFTGGWAGYFSYDLKNFIEKLPASAVDDLKLPLIKLAFYDRFIVFDHARGVFVLVVIDISGQKVSAQNKLDELKKIIDSASCKHFSAVNACQQTYPSAMNRDLFCDSVARIKNYIHEGDVYQVNLSHRVVYPYHARAVDLFHWQNSHNPSSFVAYVDCGDFSIVSASPEMFVTITEDGVISTKPIKGTMPRYDDDKLNERYYHQLVNSEKDQAELNMIIDLERNDLARVCEYGSIKVCQPRTIEAYPTLFHAVATVSGILREGMSICDVLKAMFPGGSITGAPKIRAMEVIDQLEDTARGVYTGSIGFIGINGQACLNIAIRTVIITASQAYFSVGGGIVADSVDRLEWDETLTKARALAAGIEAVNRQAKGS